VSPVLFSSLSTTANNENLTITYKIQKDVPVVEGFDRLKIVLCKLYGDLECIEKLEPILPSETTLMFPDPILFGRWKVLLYHVKSAQDISSPSRELTITRSRFNNEVFIFNYSHLWNSLIFECRFYVMSSLAAMII